MAEQIKEDFLGRYRMKVSTRFMMEKRILEKGVWEEHVVQFIKYFVKPGDTCIDVGANSGFHTIAMADKAVPGGRVIAFEPNSLTFPRLVDNINLNPSLTPSVTCHKLGLSDKEQILRVYQSGEELGNAYVSETIDKSLWNAGGEEDFELCIVKPLDEIYSGQRIDFMKIDVEGMEIFVLRGAKRLLEQHKPVIVYETLVSDFKQENIKECEVLLRSMGYHLFGLDFYYSKLVPCTFPNFQEDTLAIPSCKIIDCAEILVNASRYTGQTADGRPFAFIITAAEDHIPHIRIESPGPAVKSTGRREGSAFLFEVDQEGNSRKIAIHFDKDFQTFTGQLVDRNGASAISGQLGGGHFKG